MKAKQHATPSPVGVRLDSCARFVERVRNRLNNADLAIREWQELREKFAADLEKGEADLEALRSEAAAAVPVPPVASNRGDAEIQRLQSIIDSQQSELVQLKRQDDVSSHPAPMDRDDGAEDELLANLPHPGVKRAKVGGKVSPFACLALTAAPGQSSNDDIQPPQ